MADPVAGAVDRPDARELEPRVAAAGTPPDQPEQPRWDHRLASLGSKALGYWAARRDSLVWRGLPTTGLGCWVWWGCRRAGPPKRASVPVPAVNRAVAWQEAE